MIIPTPSEYLAEPDFPISEMSKYTPPETRGTNDSHSCGSGNPENISEPVPLLDSCLRRNGFPSPATTYLASVC